MTEYLYHIGFGVSIKADTEEDADELAKDFERGIWGSIQPEGVEVWESDIELEFVKEEEE